MGSNSIEDYSWIDDVGAGSDGDFRWTLDGLGDLSHTSGGRNESCMGPKSKACREKMRRDRLNDRFLELSSVLDPGKPPKSDKASILSDAARAVVKLRNEAQQLKEASGKLQDTIKDLKAEKNELREEKMKLKVDKERLEQQVKVTSLPRPGFLPHPAALHAAAAAAAFASGNQVSTNKAAPFPTYPGVTMWHWLPPAVLDTTQDTKLWSPNA